MRKTFGNALLVGRIALFAMNALAVTVYAQDPAAGRVYGIRPNCGSTPPRTPIPVPAACDLSQLPRPVQWSHAAACLNKLVEERADVFPGAVIGLQVDGGVPRTYSRGAADTGFRNDSIVSLASVSKPLTYVALLKAVQDHRNSPECREPPPPGQPSRCIFENPEEPYESTLRHILKVLDDRNGTRVVPDWYLKDPVNDEQEAWKHDDLRLKHIAQMTSGFPTVTFTGYRFCALNQQCQSNANEIDCGPDDPEPCITAGRYTGYLNRRGVPPDLRPRPDTGARLFDFGTYYGGRVFDSDRIARAFWHRYSFSPGLLNEPIQTGSGAWVEGRKAPEREIAQFYLGMSLTSKPGTTYRYAQQNLYIAASIVEALTGQRFDDYLREKILEPLGMKDTSFVIPDTKLSRLVDIKRLPRSSNFVLPDIAPPLSAVSAGADKNWDESRTGWRNRWPEGGAYSTAADMLRFLTFFRDGKANDGRILLGPRSLYWATKSTPDAERTYVFKTDLDADGRAVLTGNGYFLTVIRREPRTCGNTTVHVNITVLMQAILELPEFEHEGVPLCTRHWNDVRDLRSRLVEVIRAIDPCS